MGVMSFGALRYYLRFGSQMSEPEWISALPLEEQKEASELLVTIAKNESITLHEPHRNMNKTEILLRTLAAFRLPSLISSDNTTYPECAKTLSQRTYWNDLIAKKYSFEEDQNAHSIGIIKHDLMTPTTQSTERLITQTSPPTPSHKDDTTERNVWLHTVGVSREIPLFDHNYTIKFVDKIIQERLDRIFAIKPTVLELESIIPIKVDYVMKAINGSESALREEHITMPLRESFIQGYRNKFHKKSIDNDSEVIIKNLTFMLKEKASRMLYLEFVAKCETIILDNTLDIALNFFSISPDIDDAYTTMAKNRLAIALFPFMGNERNSEISQILKRWLDGSLKEKVVGLPGTDDEIMIPDVIALVDSTGGILISLTTSTSYLWTPDDATQELKNFLIQHLPLEGLTALLSTPLKTTVEQNICIINPGISFTAPDNVWRYLKSLNIRKQYDHLKHYTLTAPAGIGNDPHEHAQKLLANAVVVVSLLSFFAAGGSAAACAAVMLTNLAAGAISTGMYIDTALHTAGKETRKKAWDTALFSALITALGGASDLYNVAKTEGYAEYKNSFTLAGILKTILTAGKKGDSTATIVERFVKSDVRQRLILIVESLLRSKQTYPEFLGKNNIESMIKVSQAAGQLKTNIYDASTSSVSLDALFKSQKIISNREDLASLSAGYKLAIVDSNTKQVELLLLGLGEKKFAGYDLHALVRSAELPPKWQTVTIDDFIFTDGKLTLSDESTKILMAEEDSALANPYNGQDMTASLEIIGTKYVRYRNKLKYDHLLHKILSRTAYFAKENGYQEISYRVLCIWSEKFNNIEQRHYMVVAKKEGISFVFEPEPENIRYLDLPGLLTNGIIRESVWIDSFKKLEHSSLITYVDFNEEESAMNYHRTTALQNSDEKILTEPEDMRLWRETSASSPITYSAFLLGYEESAKQALIIKIAREAIFNDHNSISNYEFIINIFTQSGNIKIEQKELMLLNFKKDPLSSNLDLFTNPILINSLDDILHVSAGKIIRFQCQENPSISHTVISLGNGTFAGMDNGILNGVLSNIKRTVVIEQLGTFHGKIFHSFVSGFTYEVHAFDPLGLTPTQNNLLKVAEEVTNHREENQNGIRFVMNILVEAHQIAPQQADALERSLQLIFSNLEGNSVSLAKLSKCLKNRIIIKTSADLELIQEGGIILFYGGDKKYHILLSLGNKQFVGLDNHLLNQAIPPNQFIITLPQIGEISDGRLVNNDLFSSIVAGDVNLEDTRISALLGPDGRFSYITLGSKRFSLEVKAHGAAASINHYDAIDLSNIIQGINLQKHPNKTLEHIDLISCYSAFGGRRSSAQIISDRLGVTVEAYKGIVMDSKSLRRGKGILFKPHENLGSQQLIQNELWHRRIHKFIELFLGQWHRSFRRHSRQVLSEQPLRLIMTDMMYFLKKRLTLSSFSLRYPGLISTTALSEALEILEDSTHSENIITALLILIYDNVRITATIDSFILINEYNEPSDTIVHNSLEMCRSYLWESQRKMLTKYKKLIPVIPYSDIQEGQNIYVNYNDGVGGIFRETILRISKECSSRENWLKAFANYINKYNADLPVLVGGRNEDASIKQNENISDCLYLKSFSEDDFSLQIVFDSTITIGPASSLNDYVLHESVQTNFIEFSDKLDFSLFTLNKDMLSINMTNLSKNIGSRDSSTNKTQLTQIGSVQYLPRLIISIVEQGERIVILQRNFPKSIKHDNGELAFYIANEINAYTSHIKVGKKQNNTITAIKSSKENYIYIDPLYTDTSWVSINIARA